jgi:hypothetical protein
VEVAVPAAEVTLSFASRVSTLSDLDVERVCVADVVLDAAELERELLDSSALELSVLDVSEEVEVEVEVVRVYLPVVPVAVVVVASVVVA